MSVNLNFRTHGEGSPLYVLHGLLGSGRNWTSIARRLTDNFQVITVDLRNHGESGHAQSMSYPEMAGDLVALSESLGHDRFSMIGHSMGGKTAMVLSLLYPDMVEKLVVVDIAPVRYQTNHDELIAALQSLPVDTIASRSQADGILADRINDPSLRQFLLQNLIRDENGFKWRINLDAIQRNHSRLRDFPLELEGRVFSRPVMFLSGSLSGYVLPGHREVIRTYFPNAENIAIAGANHWVHADKPEQVIQKVRKFLNR